MVSGRLWRGIRADGAGQPEFPAAASGRIGRKYRHVVGVAGIAGSPQTRALARRMALEQPENPRRAGMGGTLCRSRPPPTFPLAHRPHRPPPRPMRPFRFVRRLCPAARRAPIPLQLGEHAVLGNRLCQTHCRTGVAARKTRLPRALRSRRCRRPQRRRCRTRRTMGVAAARQPAVLRHSAARWHGSRACGSRSGIRCGWICRCRITKTSCSSGSGG